MHGRLLINWVYYQPIGHALEAFRFAQAWRNANPELHIAVAINRRSAFDLAPCVPAIDEVYAIDVDEFAGELREYPSLQRIPHDWDYYFTDPRHDTPMGSAALDRCEWAMREHIHATLSNDGWSLPDGFPVTDDSPLALKLPQAARRFAEGFLSPSSPTHICLMFGSGTETSRTPPIVFWRLLIQRLIGQFPGVELVLLGSLNPERSITRGIDRAAIDGLAAEFPQLRDGFDLGLLNQLAIVERCELFISPHTGFGFAVQAVGTPWLVLSGAWAAENWINGVPFVSVYPDCPRYPCDFWSEHPARPMLEECRERKASGEVYLCLAAEALGAKLPAILEAARQLIERELPYTACTQRHYAAMIPRLGMQPGQPFMEGWPGVMDASFQFRSPYGLE